MSDANLERERGIDIESSSSIASSDRCSGTMIRRLLISSSAPGGAWRRTGNHVPLLDAWRCFLPETARRASMWYPDATMNLCRLNRWPELLRFGPRMGI